MFAWSGPLKLQISVIVPVHLQILLRYVIVVTAHVVFRSGGADKGAVPSSSQPSKRLQQTQAQVDEVCVIDLLWPPYVIGGPLYFCPVISIFLSSIYPFFSSPNLGGHRLDVYHTLAHGVALVRI